jgi:N-acyl-D-aspartate/D-glutamate deacylase
MTQVPAELYGLRGRGTACVGMQADLVAFDPDTVGSGPTHLRNDLPGGGGRMYAEARGIEHVLVNGKAVVNRGAFTPERPGRVLRSGQDTHSVTL